MPATRLFDSIPAIDVVRERLNSVLSPSGPVAAPAACLRESTGKLLRPALTLLSAMVTGEVTDEVIDTAVAVELIHTASLVHDDVVDESDTRRGLPSIRYRFGNKSAVLLGDYLFTTAFEILNRSRKRSIIRTLSAAIKSMSAGEMFNLSNLYRTDLTEDDYYRYVGYKTASLMSASCEAGALASGGGRSSSKASRSRRLSRFGWDLGMAYQVIDDLMDLTGIAEADGKPSGSDVGMGLTTLPLIRLVSTAGGAGLISAAWSEPANARRLLEALRVHGCLSYALDASRSYTQSAVARLRKFGEGPGAGMLREIVRYVEDRCDPASLEHPGTPEEAAHPVEPGAALPDAADQCAG